MAWDESEHPRESDGKFTDGAGQSKQEKLDKAKRIYGSDDEETTAGDDIGRSQSKSKAEHKEGSISGAQRGSPMTFKQADSGNCNPLFKTEQGYNKNCQTCVAVYFARRNGYDVRALPNSNNFEMWLLSYNTNMVYVDKEGNHPTYIYQQRGQSTMDMLKQNIKEGGIYTLQFEWKKHPDQGHIINAEMIDGNIVLYDPQSNSIYSGEQIEKYLEGISAPMMMDLTDCKIDEEFADKIMKKAGD